MWKSNIQFTLKRRFIGRLKIISTIGIGMIFQNYIGMPFTRRLQIISTIVILEVESVPSPGYERSFKFLRFECFVRFPCCVSMTISFNNKSPFYVSLRFTLEMYLPDALCLSINSWTWEASCSSSTRSHAYFSPILFASSSKWARRHDDVSISMGSIVSSP